MKTSNFLSLNLADLAKGLVMAAILPLVVKAQEVISTGDITFNWKEMGALALAGAVAYLAKNFFSNSAGVPFSKESN